MESPDLAVEYICETAVPRVNRSGKIVELIFKMYCGERVKTKKEKQRGKERGGKGRGGGGREREAVFTM